MYPILMRFEFGFLYSFTAIWLTAILGTTIYLWRNNRDWYQIDVWLFGLVGAIGGGRLDFVVQNQQYFRENTDEIGQFFNGGLGYYGVVCGALLATALFCQIKSRSWLRFLPSLTLLLPIWHTAGWAACWLEGCAYGQPAYIGWFTAELPDTLGIIAVRYQTQLAGIILSSLITLAIYLWLRSHDNTVTTFWLAFLLCQLTVFCISFWRADTMLFDPEPAIERRLFYILVLFSILGIAYEFLNHHRTLQGAR